ncbi:hypothetical protein ABIB37_002666 [Agrococcus sp. UYP10]
MIVNGTNAYGTGARARRAGLVVLAALAMSGCVILPPPLPTAAPVPVPTVAEPAVPSPSASEPGPAEPEPSEPAPSPEPAETEQAPELPEPTAEECAAADQALAAIVTRSSQVLDAVPADGEPDWAAADAVVAELPVMRDAFIAQTTSVALAESFRELDQPIVDMTEAVATRDSLVVTLSSASVAFAAPAALLPCAGIL